MTSPWPSQPFPQVLQRPFEIDYTRFFLDVQSKVQFSRALNKQPPLVPNNEIMVGQEQLPIMFGQSPPAICVVPKGFKIRKARKVSDTDNAGQLYSQWLVLECHLWGDDDPNKRDLLYSYSTVTELQRQLVIALCDANIGPASILITSSDFVQLTNDNRQGRSLVSTIEMETFLVRDQPALVPATLGASVIPGPAPTPTQPNTNAPQAQFTIPPTTVVPPVVPQ